MNNIKSFSWKEYGDKNYYYDNDSGKIHGLVTKYALLEVYMAVVYPNEYGNGVADEKHLGQYISRETARQATERFWDIQNRTLIEQ